MTVSIASEDRENTIYWNGESFGSDNPFDSLLRGTLKTTVTNGYAIFTDLRFASSFRSVKLRFETDSGFFAYSPTLPIYPALSLKSNISNMASNNGSIVVRRQPVVGEAGRTLIFEAGIIDSSGFLFETDSSSVAHIELLLPSSGTASFNCSSNVSNFATGCLVAVADQVRFHYTLMMLKHFTRI